jgi:hypothetical protein
MRRTVLGAVALVAAAGLGGCEGGRETPSLDPIVFDDPVSSAQDTEGAESEDEDEAGDPFAGLNLQGGPQPEDPAGLDEEWAHKDKYLVRPLDDGSGSGDGSSQGGSFAGSGTAPRPKSRGPTQDELFALENPSMQAMERQKPPSDAKGLQNAPDVKSKSGPVRVVDPWKGQKPAPAAAAPPEQASPAARLHGRDE